MRTGTEAKRVCVRGPRGLSLPSLVQVFCAHWASRYGSLCWAWGGYVPVLGKMPKSLPSPPGPPSPRFRSSPSSAPRDLGIKMSTCPAAQGGQNIHGVHAPCCELGTRPSRWPDNSTELGTGAWEVTLLVMLHGPEGQRRKGECWGPRLDVREG